MSGATSDPIGPVFAALADPTRRLMVSTMVREGSTSVPSLTQELPISRQAIAKHIATLDHAGLLERVPATGREVHYRLRARALAPAIAWLNETDAAWGQRLERLRQSFE